MTTPDPCPFCEIAAGRAPATIVHEWSDAFAIVPLNPVADGHVLVIPKTHTPDFGHDPDVSAATMKRAAQLAQKSEQPMNLITSRGREATQSVWHLHLHLILRAENDGLALPWYSGKKSPGVQINVQPKPAGELCVLPHYDYPESLCTEPAGHYVRDRDPHAAPLIINRRECGGLAWDEPENTR